jgi:protocatechuate 3,4-dioxygenase beta subunit
MRWVLAAAVLSIATRVQGPEGTATVRGRVVDGVSGRPLPDIVLNFYPQQRGPYAPGIDPEPPKRSAIAGSDGTFEVPRLVAAEYSVTGGARSDYLPIEYGMEKPGGRAKFLKVTDGARIEITLRAWRSAAIGGHVYDERGRPVIGAQVRVFEKDSDVYGSSATDDRGAYEIAGLRPGQYTVGVPVSQSNRTISSSGRQSSNASPAFPYVMDRGRRTILIPRGAPLPASADDGRARVYVTAFAGGASNRPGALYVPLGPGDVREGIDITLPVVPGIRISGLVAGPADLTGTILRLRPEGSFDDLNLGPIDATAATDGTFAFVAAPPGRYILTAYRHRPPLTEITFAGGYPVVAMDDVIMRDEEDYWAEMPIAVGDADVENLIVTLNPGTLLTGRLVYEDGDAPQAPVAGGQPRITLAAGAQPYSPDDRYVRIERDGRISMRVRPGRYQIVSGPTGAGLVLKTTIVNGRELGDEPLIVGADPLTDVQFVVGRHNTLVRGTVADARGQAAPDATVVIFPADRARWLLLAESGRMRTTRTSNGAWQFSGLTPGEYYVVALESFRGSLTSPFAATLVPHATRISVSGGLPGQTHLTVKDPE